MGELSLAPPPPMGSGLRPCRVCGVYYFPGYYRDHSDSSQIHKAKIEENKQANARRPRPGRSRSVSLETRQPEPSGYDLKSLLDEHEEGVLYLVCQKGRYDSVVTLAADYYEHTEEIQQDRVLEWNLIELLLDDLNKAGLVVYRMAPTPLGEVMVRIKPTKAGYDKITSKFKVEFNVGYIRIAGMHGHSTREQPLHGTGDKTDFRNHGDHAMGIGEVIVEDFIDHCSLCDHLNKHLAQLRELYGSDKI